MTPVIAALLATPVLFGLLLYPARTQRSIARLARTGAAAVMAVSTAFCLRNFSDILVVDLSGEAWLRQAALLGDALIAAYLIRAAWLNRSPLLGAMSLAQFLVVAGTELLHGGPATGKTLIIDKLSLLMIAIAGVVGGLICVYAIEYMKDYHRHHPEVEDRRGLFFAVLFIFLSAMFGLVIGNDLTLVLLCWEATTLASFILIGYSRTPEAVANSLLAANINVFGGLLFSIGAALAAIGGGVGDFASLIEGGGGPLTGLVVFLLAGAALTKSAQIPFSRWLLGAMVAPTPTSAMLHSSTMVKAGVYLLLRLSPLLGHSPAGVAVTVIGGATFLFAALLAVTQSDAKLVLAYSTISNLGLITACAGIDTGDALWAAIMLSVFHAIAKALLFLSVGSTEHQMGSRNIEDMDGMIRISHQLAMFLIIGIAGMFMAPFGMLIAKWAAMRAFLDSGNIVTVLMIAFGSSVSLFFWTKWMGKLVSNVHRTPPTSYVMRIDEKVALHALATLMALACLLYPLLSIWFVEPYLAGHQFASFASPINRAASRITTFMLCLLFILPMVLLPMFRKFTRRQALIYMSGENAGDDERFRSGDGTTHRLESRNWYLRGLLYEAPLRQAGTLVGIAVLLAGLSAAVGEFAG